IARGIVGGQRPSGGWSYRSDDMGIHPEDDHSNTQYALLGLKCAARGGVAIESSVWGRALDHYISQQCGSGEAVPPKTGGRPAHAFGWTYVDAGPRNPTASMTAGGVSSLV